MKILFVICGEGLGHASRCLHLGHYLQLAGHTVHFAGYGKSYDFMKQHHCTHLHETPREVCLEGEDGFFSLKKTLWCSKWIFFDMIRSVLSVRRLIREHKFDCVVCDTMYGGVLAGRLEKTPLIFITNQNHFNGPNGATNPVWRVLNFMIRRYLKLADHILVPDYPAPDTVSEYNVRVPEGEEGRYSFTGPFYDFDPARYQYARETIFTSFGGEPYKLPMYLLLRSIADRHKDIVFDVFYTGASLPESSDNFLSHGYVPNLYEHLARAKIAIVHGGLTMLENSESAAQLVLSVRGGDDGADARLALRDGGKADALREHACGEKLAGEFVRQRRVADNDRRDGSFAHAGVEAQLLQAFLEEFACSPKADR